MQLNFSQDDWNRLSPNEKRCLRRIAESGDGTLQFDLVQSLVRVSNASINALIARGLVVEGQLAKGRAYKTTDKGNHAIEWMRRNGKL